MKEIKQFFVYVLQLWFTYMLSLIITYNRYGRNSLC